MALPGAVRRLAHRLTLLTTTTATLAAGTLAGAVLSAAPTNAAARTSANPVTPGDFTGLGFDQCLAPSAAAMKSWWLSSPYTAVGIYIAGASRGCPKQPNLTPDWITQQQALGWRLLPITLGPQASCTTRDRYLKQVRIDATSSGDYSKARTQGTQEAYRTVQTARALGISAGSTMFYDLEAFDISRASCRDSALAFLSSWTERLHQLGYVSGAYSSAGSGIKAMAAATTKPDRFTMPDQLWIADWNGTANTHTDYISDTLWDNHRRVHQYRGGHDETYADVRINIDSNYVDLGRGSRPPPKRAACGGTTIDRVSYPVIEVGSTDSDATKALQCLLTERGFYQGSVSGSYDLATRRAARAFQAKVGLPVSSRWNSPAWVSLLTQGQADTIKLGSSGEDVRRFQRAMNASGIAKLAMHGVATWSTMGAVSAYRRKIGLTASAVLTQRVWSDLRRGTY